MPPPAFGSPAFIAALAEVRQISDTRTAEQLALAQYWHVNQSPLSNAAWDAMARELIVKYRKSDAEAARILFLMYSAVWDWGIGWFDAKYAYWLIRPSQADPAITLPVGLPNHPSYPSAHSCADGAVSGILQVAFPSERGQLEEMAQEASGSRLYAGLHYRFDKVVGWRSAGQPPPRLWRRTWRRLRHSHNRYGDCGISSARTRRTRSTSGRAAGIAAREAVAVRCSSRVAGWGFPILPQTQSRGTGRTTATRTWSAVVRRLSGLRS